MIEALALAGWITLQPQPTPAPYVGEWTVEVVDNVKVMSDSRITMHLLRSGIRGVAPCNSYQGNITGDEDGGLRVSSLLKTLKACDSVRTAEEQDFFAILREVTSYEVRGEILTLRTPVGKAISARRVPTSQ